MPGVDTVRSMATRRKQAADVDGRPPRTGVGRATPAKPSGVKKLKREIYEAELERAQLELVKLQDWVKANGLKVVVLFEGRDAAGKGGTIKRVSEPLNPRICRIAALATPTERERTEWYFQRYVAHLPSAGEIVLFDRSWYNRAGVEHVMGFCTEEEYAEFLVSVPEFERILIRSGTILVKYWFSVSDEEQERRFKDRITHRIKRWKISPMDLEARRRWFDYAKAKDNMFLHTDVPDSPWWVVDADDKRRARLNCIHHLLSVIPYEEIDPSKLKVPRRQPADPHYQRPPIESQRWIPDLF
jgi:polyphosphate kinase 2